MKDTFFKSTLILLIGGLITKVLGMIIKIIMTRIVGIDSMSLYMLIFPTFALFMTISQLGLSTALSKIIAERPSKSKNILLSIIPISLLFNLLLMILIILISPIITKFLNNQNALYPIISIAFVLPFDSLSSILRGYFFGKERMLPHIISLITEQIVRLLLIIFFIPSLLNKGIVIVVSFLVLINIISEFTSSVVMLLFIKDKKIKKSDLKSCKEDVKDVFKIAIPTVSSRLIGSISYFLEPIIITTFLIINGYDINFIVKEYGIIEGYVLPLLLLPSFLMNALSSALIPDISKKFIKKDYISIRKRFRNSIFISLILGFVSSLLLFLFPNFFLKTIYNVNNGEHYLRVLSFFLIFLYMGYPLESILQGLNEAKSIMINNTIGVIVKSSLILILSYFKIGLYNLIISIIISIILIFYLNIKKVKKLLYS